MTANSFTASMVNCLATIQWLKSSKIDVKKLKGPGIRHKPNFDGKVSKAFNGYTAMIYNSGKVTIIGVRDLAVLPRAEAEIKQFLGNQGYDFESCGTQIRNCIYTGTVGKKLNLGEVFGKILKIKPTDGSWHLEYEHEHYPAVVLRVQGAGTAMVYSSGKVITTGVSDPTVGRKFCEQIMKMMP